MKQIWKLVFNLNLASFEIILSDIKQYQKLADTFSLSDLKTEIKDHEKKHFCFKSLSDKNEIFFGIISFGTYLFKKMSLLI